jgi:hypothetical protein
MSEINYLKFSYYVRWYESVACGRYKLVYGVNILHVKRITVNDW